MFSLAQFQQALLLHFFPAPKGLFSSLASESWERVWEARRNFVPVLPVGRRIPNPARQHAQRMLGWE